MNAQTLNEDVFFMLTAIYLYALSKCLYYNKTKIQESVFFLWQSVQLSKLQVDCMDKTNFLSIILNFEFFTVHTIT